jgi:hypothetical protein
VALKIRVLRCLDYLLRQHLPGGWHRPGLWYLRLDYTLELARNPSSDWTGAGVFLQLASWLPLVVYLVIKPGHQRQCMKPAGVDGLYEKKDALSINSPIKPIPCGSVFHTMDMCSCFVS